MDRYSSSPTYSSCSMSVYAKPGIAKDPLHCPIKLTGINPEKTIYINRTPPHPPRSSQTSRETVESILT